MPVTPEARARFQAEFAEKVVKRPEGRRPRIPVTSPMLTWAMTGGVPVGHFCRWYGPEGSGKSLTNLGLMIAAQNYPEIISYRYEVQIRAMERAGKKLAAHALKKRMKYEMGLFPDGMSIYMFDTEQRFEWDFAERLGVDISKDKLEVSEENIIENIVDDMKSAIDAYHIIIVDSVSNAESYAEANLQPGEYERGTAAAAWKRLRQVRRLFDRNENTIIFVDQVRTQLGKQGGPRGGTPVMPPQIRFLKHNVSVSVEYSEGSRLYLDKNRLLTDDWNKADNSIVTLGTDGKEVAGLEMRCKIMKNSTGRPFRNARMRFRFDATDMRTGEVMQDIGFDEGFELLESAIAFGIIKDKGSGNHVVLDDDGDETKLKWRSGAAARAGVIEDEELRDRIHERLIMAS